VAVELALAVPILLAGLLLMMACFKVGAAHIDVTSAAGAAARAAAAQRTPAAATTAAQATASALLGDQCDQTTTSVDIGQFRPGGTVTVTLTCTTSLRKLTGFGLPTAVTTRASATSPLDVLRTTS
jgi:Flp pilus assembly protein TadG